MTVKFYANCHSISFSSVARLDVDVRIDSFVSRAYCIYECVRRFLEQSWEIDIVDGICGLMYEIRSSGWRMRQK